MPKNRYNKVDRNFRQEVSYMDRRLNKLGALAMSAALASSLLLHIFPAVSVYAASELSAFEITEQMGVGWNLGNSLDSAIQGFSSGNILDYETQWGNPVVTKSLIDKVKAKGFNTVRIPVTWYQHISSDGSYTIDNAWMSRVRSAAMTNGWEMKN